VPRALDVWLPLPVPPLLYLAPHGREAVAGARVAVPWQGGVRIGIVAHVVEVGAAQALELREPIGFVDDEPWLLAPARRMLAAQAARVGASPGVALATTLAVGLHEPLLHEVRPLAGVERSALGPGGESLRDDAWIDAEGLDPNALALWRDHGLIRERVCPRPELTRVIKVARTADAALGGTRAAQQRTALEHLAAVGELPSAAELARAAAVGESAVRALVTKGYVEYAEVEAPLPPPPWAVAEGAAPGAAVPRAAAAWPAAERRVLVVGGSVAERLAHLVAAVAAEVGAGGQALVLVPELAALAALAPALASVAPTLLLHGELAPRLREAAWREAARGAPLVALGTVGALCLPLPRLSRVLVWDAASPSYKGQAGTRSVARRDAEVLADAAHVGLALFDPIDTPELRAVRGARTIREPIPPLRLVTSDLRASSTWPLGGDLIRTLKQVAERERQGLVLVPRRGFSAGLACSDCGSSVMCPNCDLPLRWHARAHRLRCHQCGHDGAAPAVCGVCGGSAFQPLQGAGTEWVAREVAQLVQPLEVVVVDADHRPDLQRLYDGAPGVIVATTAALRLAPLPLLSLVALTLGDALYAQEDFRADERALRTMLALGELAGGRRPLVLVQTFLPEHPLWQALAAPDADAAVRAYLDDLEARRVRFGYPPAQEWARLHVTHKDEGSARRAALALAATLTTSGVPADALLGPAPAGVARLRGRYAQQLFLRAGDDLTLAEALSHVPTRPGGGARVRIDVDPYDVVAFIE
jgi:primosomal protein N' (replication factor Y) (superfamily II helicase)